MTHKTQLQIWDEQISADNEAASSSWAKVKDKQDPITSKWLRKRQYI